MSSIIDGFRQNDCNVIVYDELFDKNLKQTLRRKFEYIAGYDYSGLKIKVDNNLDVPSINYFSDDLRSKTSGPEWEKYLPFLEADDNYTFYWDKILTGYENFKNINYLPHFVNFDVYQDFGIEPEFDIMFGKGISRAGDILDLATNIDLVKKSGAWYAYEGEKIGQGRENAKAYLESHPEVMETLDQKVRAHYALSGSEEAENELPDAEKKTGASSDLKLTPASKVADEAEKKE